VSVSYSSNQVRLTGDPTVLDLRVVRRPAAEPMTFAAAEAAPRATWRSRATARYARMEAQPPAHDLHHGVLAGPQLATAGGAFQRDGAAGEVAQQRRDTCLTIGAAVCAGRGVDAVGVLVVGDAGGDAEPRQQLVSLLRGPHPRAVSRHPRPNDRAIVSTPSAPESPPPEP
jgi:hypothetical protein